MASNPYVNKVVYGGTTLIDISDTTATADKILSGYGAYGADGNRITGNIANKSSSDLTASGATVTAPAGFYPNAASKAVVSGTAGTPTATKGTVSNHSISVTPSVTNTTGYITGGTKNGTAVTVNVAELESGTKSITENGTGISVSGYSTVDVSVAGQTPYLKYWIELDSSSGLDVSVRTTYTNSTIYVDWGDGSYNTYNDGSYPSHTYSEYGKYCIDIKLQSGSYLCPAADVLNQNSLMQMRPVLLGAEVGCYGTTTLPRAFRVCDNIWYVKMSEGVTTINGLMFINCSSLSYFVVPSSVTSIGNSAFNNAGSSSKKIDVYMQSVAPPTLGKTAFTTSTLNAIHVPSGSLAAYQSATNWSDFSSYIVEG